MQDYYLKTDYALSGRAQCRGCLKKIEKTKHRIAFVTDLDQQYHSEKWYHIDCFKSLPKKVADVDIESIMGYEQLKTSDKGVMRALLIELKNQPIKRRQSNKPKTKESQKKGKSTGREKSTRREKSTGREKKQKEEEEEDDEEYSPNDDDDEVDNGKVGGDKQIKGKSQPKDYQIIDDDDSSYSEVKPAGYSDEEWQSIKKNLDDLELEYAAVLKEMLKYNNQPCTGTKYEMIERVAEGIAMGAIPKCKNCIGGRPKFDKNTGKYRCPGFMDDTQFKHCNKIFSRSEINRVPWKEL